MKKCVVCDKKIGFFEKNKLGCKHCLNIMTKVGKIILTNFVNKLKDDLNKKEYDKLANYAVKIGIEEELWNEFNKSEGWQKAILNLCFGERIRYMIQLSFDQFIMFIEQGVSKFEINDRQTAISKDFGLNNFNDNGNYEFIKGDDYLDMFPIYVYVNNTIKSYYEAFIETLYGIGAEAESPFFNLLNKEEKEE